MFSGGGATASGGPAGGLRSVARALFYVALPLLIVCTAVRVLFSTQAVYSYAIDHYHADLATGINHNDLIAATQDIRAYFSNSEEYLHTLVHDQNGEVVPLFNAREVLHMHDVKAVVRVVNATQAWSLAVVAAYVIVVVLWAGEESLSTLARRTVRAVLATLALLLLFGAVAAAGGFDAAFIKFHQLVFHNDYWQLDPARDHLVQIFPEGFWLDATVLLCTLIAVQCAAIGGGAWLYLRRHGETSGDEAPSAPAAPLDEATDERRAPVHTA